MNAVDWLGFPANLIGNNISQWMVLKHSFEAPHIYRTVESNLSPINLNFFLNHLNIAGVPKIHS
jgi:hypothetical protein